MGIHPDQIVDLRIGYLVEAMEKFDPCWSLTPLALGVYLPTCTCSNGNENFIKDLDRLIEPIPNSFLISLFTTLFFLF